MNYFASGPAVCSSCVFVNTFAAPAGTSGVPGIATRTVTQDDGREASGRCSVRRVVRGGSAESVEKPLRASQGPGREGIGLTSISPQYCPCNGL